MLRTFAHTLLTILALLLTLAFGAAVSGCSNSSGRQLPPGSSHADLEVKNRTANVLHVYVDGGEIGRAQPLSSAQFKVLSGERTVSVRESGHSSHHSFGKIPFGLIEVELSYP